MTLQEANLYLKSRLDIIYESREAATICDWVLEKLTGLKKIDRLVSKESLLSNVQQNQLGIYIDDLVSHKPVQYVLSEADFFGLKFYVDENVLIPRPETEELVEWVLKDNAVAPLSLLDIGTGSGCIAIALKAKRKNWKVAACDNSEGALSVAGRNAAMNQVNVELVLCDILNTSQSSSLNVYDIIISNPPYIPPSAKTAMSKNVVAFEPHAALFTPDEDPYLFYRTIGSLGLNHLSDKGRLYFEIHEEGAPGVAEILRHQGYRNIVVRNDLYNRPRMIAAEK